MNEHRMPFYSTYISWCLCLFHFEQHITKMMAITAYKHFQPCLQVSHCFPCHIFWYCWNLLKNCDLEIMDGPWSSGVHFRFEVPRKGNYQRQRYQANVQAMEARRAVKRAPETFSEQPPWMLLLYGQLNHLAGTICSRAQFHYDSVLVWGSSINIST
jgi:hypothetical protein